MDQLSYAYEGNRLVGVDDAAAAAGPAGDFRDNGNGNGNLTADQNKGIPYIRYNHLNLPDSVVVAGQGQIYYYYYYYYSASGTKLRKVVYENNKPVVTTDYAGLFLYQADTLFAHTPEGWVLYQPETDETWRYEYHLKDHLGNLRVSFAAPVSSTAPATMEPMLAQTEESDFGNVARTRHLDRGRSRTGSHAALLSAGRNRPVVKGKNVGPNLQFSHSEDMVAGNASSCK